jgi:sortase (surface protein transpeptidase)
MFGHLDSYTGPAVFWRLRDLKAGDRIEVTYPGGKTVAFRVMWQSSYPNNRVPVRWMVARAQQRGLALVTCAGVFRQDGVGYDHKLVVYARMILANGRLG